MASSRKVEGREVEEEEEKEKEGEIQKVKLWKRCEEHHKSVIDGNEERPKRRRKKGARGSLKPGQFVEV